MIIKDFWKEQWEDKKQQKRQKKEKRKGVTKEDKAYRWGYTIFLIFFVIFFIIKSCTGSSLPIDEDTLEDLSLYGYTKEVLELLSTPINESDVLKGSKISSTSAWSAFVLKCESSRLNIFKDDDFDDNKVFLDSGCDFDTFQLNSLETAGAILRLIENGSDKGITELYEFSLFENDDTLQMESLIYLHMSSILNKESIPNMYVRTVSDIEFICDELVLTNTKIFINNLSEEENETVINSINGGLFMAGNIESYTNDRLLDKILEFGLMIGADVTISDDCLNFSKLIFSN